jgi:hypothetical protein
MRQRSRAGADAKEIRERAAEWAERLRVAPTQIRVQQMTRKWGSCSPAGRVTFARELLVEGKGFREYVIVHELLHLRLRNHGRLFRSYLSVHLPGWQRHAERLDLGPSSGGPRART